jgi:hypothetical protein
MILPSSGTSVAVIFSLKNLHEHACGLELSFQKPHPIRDTGENRPMTDREDGREIMIQLPEHFLELVSVFI